MNPSLTITMGSRACEPIAVLSSLALVSLFQVAFRGEKRVCQSGIL